MHMAQVILLKLKLRKALSQNMEHFKHLRVLEDVFKLLPYLEDANKFLQIFTFMGQLPRPLVDSPSLEI